MGNNDDYLSGRISAITKAWSVLRAHKSFSGMSLEDFKKAIAPSLDARAAVSELETQMGQATERRDDADVLTRKLIQRVVNAVKADPEEGEDGELYSAMGYMPRAVRSSLQSIGRAAKKSAKGDANNAATSKDRDKEVDEA